VTKQLVTHLVNRISQFSEWGQVSVLNILYRYEPESDEEIFDIMNILESLLTQSSAAVVL